MGKLNDSEISKLQEASDDDDWKLGGRYVITRSASLYKNQTLDGKRVALTVGSVLLLVGISGEPGAKVGLFCRFKDFTAGWLSLESHREDSPQSGPKKTACLKCSRHPAACPLKKKALPSSWVMKGLYKVRSLSTLRETKEMGSAYIGQLDAGDEVLILDLGVSSHVDPRLCTLRAMVSTKDELVGWMSPLSQEGDELLDTFNLLSPQVAEDHRRSLKAIQLPGVEAGYPRKSCIGGENNLPWVVGGCYRTLEDCDCRAQSNSASHVIGTVSAGSLVKVLYVYTVGGNLTNHLAVAQVHVLEGHFKGCDGWLNCSSHDGHNVLDVRDLAEYQQLEEKVKERFSVRQDPSHLESSKDVLNSHAPSVEQPEAAENDYVRKDSFLASVREHNEDLMWQRTQVAQLTDELTQLRTQMMKLKETSEREEKKPPEIGSHQFLLDESRQQSGWCCGRS